MWVFCSQVPIEKSTSNNPTCRLRASRSTRFFSTCTRTVVTDDLPKSSSSAVLSQFTEKPVSDVFALSFFFCLNGFGFSKRFQWHFQHKCFFLTKYPLLNTRRTKLVGRLCTTHFISQLMLECSLSELKFTFVVPVFPRRSLVLILFSGPLVFLYEQC